METDGGGWTVSFFVIYFHNFLQISQTTKKSKLFHVILSYFYFNKAPLKAIK